MNSTAGSAPSQTASGISTPSGRGFTCRAWMLSVAGFPAPGAASTRDSENRTASATAVRISRVEAAQRSNIWWLDALSSILFVRREGISAVLPYADALHDAG